MAPITQRAPPLADEESHFGLKDSERKTLTSSHCQLGAVGLVVESVDLYGALGSNRRKKSVGQMSLCKDQKEMP
ncbi:hypothetical protein EVAR_39344_1 [Eumeta japonica]|uniref:Uncharacterized protein n=1 Tax=Eumeta variegata TaxID=151549 RepID=A0A4C1WMW0_EUMVA|nr:hypothetical protein EVAR_39344_1 [Eumeta japonica]